MNDTSIGTDGRVVLVGWSFGGYTAQLFAHRYAFRTAGIVLVDSSLPRQHEEPAFASKVRRRVSRKRGGHDGSATLHFA